METRDLVQMPAPPTDEEIEASKEQALRTAKASGIMLMKSGDNFVGVKKTGPADKPYQAVVTKMLVTKVLGSFVSAEEAALAYAAHEGATLVGVDGNVPAPTEQAAPEAGSSDTI